MYKRQEQLGVALDAHAGAQAVQDQGLMGLGDAQLPRQASVLDGSTRCCTCLLYTSRTLSEHSANCQKAAQVNKTVNTEK